MRPLLSLSVASSLLLLSACNVMSPGNVELETPEEIARAAREQKRMELEKQVRNQLSQAGELILEHKYDQAEELLLPLEKYGFIRDELAVVKKSLAIGRQDSNRTTNANLTNKSMMAETESQLAMPKTYGTTVVIDSKLDPLELPVGKMEDLINRKVTMNLESATVGMLVDFLNENGLNVIADDALASQKTLTMKVTDVPLKEVFSYVARNMGIAFYVGENMVWITAGEEAGGPKLETRILRLRQGFVPSVPAGGGAPGMKGGGGSGSVPSVDDTDLEDVLTAFFEGGPEGSMFQIFRTRNIVVVRNTRENIRLVEQLIREFDQPPRQVTIEARFVTVGQDDLRDVGVQISQTVAGDYTAEDGRQSGVRSKEKNFISNLGQLTEANGLGSLTISGVVGKRIFDMMIAAIDSKQSSVTLSVPRVTVMNNRSARIRKGDNMYFFKEYDLESIDKGDSGSEERLVPSGDPEELPLGITFDVNVNIGNDGKTVLLGLRPEMVSFIKWEDYLTSGDDDDDDDNDHNNNNNGETSNLTPIRLPRTHEQSIMTTVGVESGETVVLGGLVENAKKKMVRKIPFLGDLPLIGFFFRRTETTEVPVNLLIFVTATIINDRGEFVKTVAPAPVTGGAKR